MIMGKKTLVSVVVPVYNNESLIERVLDALTCQTLDNVEIIIVDDASSDKTKEIVRSYKVNAEDSNIVLICQSENKGVHEARLAGLQKACGDWIGFVDADDIVKPDMFEVMYSAAKNNDVDIVICGCNRVTESGKRIKPYVRFKNNRLIDSDVFKRYCQLEFKSGVLWNKLYRKEVILPFKNLYFPWRQDFNEDYLLNIGCFSRAKSVYLLKDMLYEYTYSPRSATSLHNRERRFVNLYRSYSLAMSVYSVSEDISNFLITVLYKEQLKGAHLMVSNIDSLLKYDSDMKEAVDRVYKVYPEGLALLSIPLEPNIKLLFKLVAIKIRRLFGV
jgi:glycosyltransferase involved in cell wall biosynthesis